MQYFRYAKSELGAAEREKQKSELARRRHEFRVQRIERDEAERQARLQAMKARKPAAAPASDAAPATGTPATAAPVTPDDDPKKAAIAEAAGRSRSTITGWLKAAADDADREGHPALTVVSSR